MLMIQNHMYEMRIHPKQLCFTFMEQDKYMQNAVKDQLNSIYGIMKGGDNNACKEENNGSAEGSEKDTAK